MKDALPAYRRFLPSVLTVFLVAGLAAAPADAQMRAETSTPRWTMHIEAQIDDLLRGDDPAVREDAILLVLELAQRDMPGVELASTVPGLFAIFEDGRQNENLRMFALAALHATGSERSYSYLRSWAQRGERTSPRVRTQVLRILKAYQDQNGIT